MKKYRAKITFESEGYTEGDAVEVILFALQQEIDSEGKHIIVGKIDEESDEWFEENKNSTLLQEKFLSCLHDDPDTTLCFRDWAKEYFKKSKES